VARAAVIEYRNFQRKEVNEYQTLFNVVTNELDNFYTVFGHKDYDSESTKLLFGILNRKDYLENKLVELDNQDK